MGTKKDYRYLNPLREWMYKKLIFKSWLRFKEDYYRLHPVKERTSVTQHNFLATDIAGEQYKLADDCDASTKDLRKVEIKINSNNITKKFAWLREEDTNLNR